MLDKMSYDLALYRLQKAEECLKDARILLEQESYMACANRAYYAIFHSTRAILAIDGEDRKRHSGVIAYFQENYVKSGIFDKTFSYILQNAFEIRQEVDYEDFYVVGKDDVITQVDNAEKFYKGIEKYIKTLEI